MKHYKILPLLLVVFLLGINENILAQSKTIEGLVLDSKTGNPIVNVHILSHKDQSGDVSSLDGNFKLKVNEFPAYYLVSHISYEDQMLEITESDFKNDIKIFLEPKISELKEAVIVASKNVFKNNDIWVMDFEFIDTNILILGKNHTKDKYELILTNVHFDTLKTLEIPISLKAQRLYKDCLGNCHLRTNQKVFQIISDGSLLYLHYPVEIEEFEHIMGNCLFETEDYLIFETKTRNRYYKEYYAVTKKYGNRLHFIRNFEKKKIMELQEQLGVMLKVSEESGRHYGATPRFEQEFMYKPAYHCLKKIGGSIIYFNHAHNSIDIFSDTLGFLNSIGIDYHLKNNWKEEIYLDEIKGQAYTIFENNNHKELYEINLKTGDIKYKMTVPFLFPDKLLINNGYLYVLHKDYFTKFDKKGVYFYKINY